MLTLLSLTALSTPVHAFCGTFVGQAGEDLVNRTSEVILARSGTRTTLTLTNDYEGSLSQFALLIPVPVVLQEEDVRVLASWVPDELERYSGPRLVQYTCDDFHDHYYPWSPSLGCGGPDYALESASGGYYYDTGGSSDDTVNVEAEFEVGEYEIVVLSAEESDGLLNWLANNGYAIAPEAEEILQDYIDSGSYFFAAKVDLAENLGETTLSPLQFSYDSEVFSLPIRLGTVNSPGEQDLIIYALTDWEDGRLGIANYAERTLSDNECMIPSDTPFDSWYAEHVAEALSGTEAGWLFEYGWAPYHCDPCPDGEALSDALVQELGFPEGAFSAYFSRIRMRYTPEQATEDLVLYASGITNNTQVRVITYDESFEDRFPICDEGLVAVDPGDCEDEFSQLTREERSEYRQENREGCATLDGPGRGLALLVLAMGGLAIRRRREIS
jgi:hypothetical protein